MPDHTLSARIRRLEGLPEDDPARLVAQVRAVLPRAVVPADRARLLLLELAGLLRLGGGGHERVLAELTELVELSGDRIVQARFHTLAARAALDRGVVQETLVRLVRGRQALDAVPEPGRPGVLILREQAAVYSLAGFHDQAALTAELATRMAERAGLNPRRYVAAWVLTRRALALDHAGDPAGCAAALRDIAALRGVLPQEQPFVEYAGLRLAALGEGTADGTVRADGSYLTALGEACRAIAQGDGPAALRWLEPLDPAACPVGPAEVPRLRALAHAAAGDERRAREADRQVAAQITGPARALPGLLLEGVTATLEQDELRRDLEHTTGEAHTDALTGLPNRRHLDRYLAGARGGHGVLCVADLDGFKGVNDRHGHPVGDLVLQQVGRILTGGLRAGDYLARYGGDEFVLVLPGTELSEAERVAGRLSDTMAGYEWAGLVPGTPVALSYGLARYDANRPPDEALRVADAAMLRAKDSAARIRRPPVAVRTFADVLDEAIERRSLSLEQLQGMLMAEDVAVTLGMLSRWRRGLAAPRSSHTTRAVAVLEKVLGEPPGTLAGLLALRAGLGRYRRRPDPVPFEQVLEKHEVVGRLLRELGLPGLPLNPAVEWLSVHDVYELDAAGAESLLRVTHVGRARAAVDRYRVMFAVEDLASRSPQVKGLRGCHTGRVLLDEPSGVMLAELLLDAPLARGEVMMAEYSVAMAPGGASEYRGHRGFAVGGAQFVAEVHFHPDAVPVRCFEFTQPTLDSPIRVVREVPIGRDHTALMAVGRVDPGDWGLFWEWD
ncbi:GGDEF domain-containing protein [Longispora sp. NPDC051575]|uniref:GGDEF domain-containing protein n=1 Tax=Longispora sp. NPDC051575 TaxID=3154943 RepID=UPI003443D078